MTAAKKSLISAQLAQYKDQIAHENEEDIIEKSKEESKKEEVIDIKKEDEGSSEATVTIIETIPKNEDKEVTVVQELKDTTKQTKKNTKGKTLEEIVKDYIKKIEDAKASENKPSISFIPGERIKFDDKYPILSSPARTEIHEIINILTKNSPLKKYEIVELLIYNGLKNLFDGE